MLRTCVIGYEGIKSIMDYHNDNCLFSVDNISTIHTIYTLLILVPDMHL